MTSLLFRLARGAAWGRAIGRALAGRPRALARRFINRPFYKALGRFNPGRRLLP